MELNISKKLLVNDKLTALLQRNMYHEHYTLKTVQPNSVSKTPIAIQANLLQYGPSVPSFEFAVLFKPFVLCFA